MPMVIAPALVAAGLTGGIEIAGLGTVAFANVAAYGISLGATVGSTLLLNSLQKREHQNSQITIRQSITPRVFAYGRVKIGGAMCYMSADRTLVQQIVFCEGPIHQFVEVWLSDKQCPYGIGSLFCNGGWSWADKVAINLQTGATGQSVNPGFAAAGHYWWDGTHQLRGLANATLACSLPDHAEKNFTKFYPAGVPPLRVVLDGFKIYDPRTGGTAWSDNPALIARHYLTDPRGFNIPASRIDDDSFKAFANVCAGAVPLGAGGTEPRYSFWGTGTRAEPPVQFLRRVLASGDGELYPTAAGKIGLRGGIWTAPSVTIGDDMIVSAEIQHWNEEPAVFNQIRIRYTDTSFYGDFQPLEGGPWDDAASQTVMGQVLPRDFDGTTSKSYLQARRLAKIAMFKGNPEWTLNLHTNLAALNALGERIVTVVLAEAGINTTFLITKFEIAGDFSGCMISLVSLTADAYQWDVSQEGHGAPVSPISPPGIAVPAVSGLTLSAVFTTATGGVRVAQVAAVITPPADLSFGFVAQISGDGGATWTDMAATGDWSAISGVVNQGASYQVRAAINGGGSGLGAYSTASITPVFDTVAPAAVSGFSAAAASPGINLAWTNPGSANFYEAQIFRGTTSTFSAAVSIGFLPGVPSGAAAYADTPGASGTYFYWIKALNGSGVASAAVGPQSASI